MCKGRIGREEGHFIVKKLVWSIASAAILFSGCNPVEEVKEFVEPKNEVIHVVINGQQLTFDVPPLINEGRTFVPLRGIFEALGAKVQFNDATADVIVKKENRTILLHTGGKNDEASPYAVVDGEVIKMQTSPRVVNGRTLIPVRFVGDVFGADVQWIGQNQTVKISTKSDSDNDTKQENVLIVDKDVPNTLIRSGHKYVGEIADELPNGEGILLDHRLNSIYQGSWIKGIPTGNGEFHLNKDTFITGTFINGLPTEGKLFNKGNLVFEGSFYSSTKLKSGKLRLADGVLFKGDITTDQTHATGVVYTDAGSTLFTGTIQLQGNLLTGDLKYYQNK